MSFEKNVKKPKHFKQNKRVISSVHLHVPWPAFRTSAPPNNSSGKFSDGKNVSDVDNLLLCGTYSRSTLENAFSWFHADCTDFILKTNYKDSTKRQGI